MSHSRRLELPKPKHLTLLGIVAVLVLMVIWRLTLPAVFGAQLGTRSLKLGSSEGTVTTDYVLSFNLSTAAALGSVDVLFCAEGPIVGDPCTPPVGFDASTAVLASQTGPGGFSISGASTANDIILTRTPALFAPVGPVSFHFTGIQNPTDPGTYYARIQTFGSNDISGFASDYGGVVFAITNRIEITATVPPYLFFCTGVTITGLNCANAVGDFVDFGELSHTQARTGSSQMLVATNARLGYSVSANGTTMTSGSNFISAMPVDDVSRPGQAQFGFNLRQNSAPANGAEPTGPGFATPQAAYNQPNIFKFNSGDTIVATTVPDTVRLFTISYITNVPPPQAPGVYVSTITYVCLATF